MTYHDNEEDRQRRTKKLTEGICDCCGKEPAMIPWKGGKFGYRCWQNIWACVMEGENEKKKKKEAEQAPYSSA